MSTATVRATLPGGSKKPTTKAKRSTAQNRGRPQGSRNKFFGLPIVDAKESLTIPLLQVDVEKAEAAKAEDVNDQENFLGCVIAQAGTRVCGAQRVSIMRQHAYVAYPGDKRALRYRIDSRSRAVLEAWDRGEHIVEGVELRLLAPSNANTLAAIRKQSRKYRKANPTTRNTRKTGRKQRPSDPLHNIVRNGNLVRFAG